MKEGRFENPKELKKYIADVTALFKVLGAEEALVKTLPQVFNRKPSERGGFDEIALQSFDLHMETYFSSLISNIEAADAMVFDKEIATTVWGVAIEPADNKKRESDEAF